MMLLKKITVRNNSQLLKGITFFLLSLFLIGCNKQSAQLTSQSDNGEVEIQVTGERYFKSDPWKVNIQVKAFRFNESLAFEFYGNAFSKENVNFNWIDNNSCEISFQERNGKTMVFRLDVSKDQIHLRKIR